MFFQQFFGVFENSYDQSTGTQVSQMAQVYISNWNMMPASYIGNETLPMGTNPFIIVPPTPSTSSTSIVWIIILCVIIVLLASFLGWTLYKWRQSAKETDDKRYVVYAENNDEPLASQTNFNDVSI